MPRNSLSDVLPSKTPRERVQLSVAYKLILTGRRWRARLRERLAERGQTDVHQSALYHLATSPLGLIQTELAERIGIKGPALVRQLDTLERQRLVRRENLVGDRRAKLVRLEPGGIETLQALDVIAADLRDELMGDLPEDELLRIEAILDTLLDRLAPHVDGDPPGPDAPDRPQRARRLKPGLTDRLQRRGTASGERAVPAAALAVRTAPGKARDRLIAPRPRGD